jgi:2-iminobutanoate/2-iminopropanoate deaminase
MMPVTYDTFGNIASAVVNEGAAMRTINPDTIIKPASAYAQAVLLSSIGGQRLLISGQVGVTPDGKTEAGMRAQMERTWTNLLTVLFTADFEIKHLIKVTTFVTEPGQTALYRELRDSALQGHLCAATYLQVAGLASPDFLVEIEAEAVKPS